MLAGLHIKHSSLCILKKLDINNIEQESWSFKTVPSDKVEAKCLLLWQWHLSITGSDLFSVLHNSSLERDVSTISNSRPSCNGVTLAAGLGYCLNINLSVQSAWSVRRQGKHNHSRQWCPRLFLFLFLSVFIKILG